MSDPILGGVKAGVGYFDTLVVKRIQEYLKFIGSYDTNMTALINELNVLCAKKLDLDTKVMEEMADLRKMTRVTANWRNSIMELIEGEEMKKLMKEERVAEIVVKMIERPLLKKFWEEDREIFDILVRVVKKKCNQEIVGVEVDAEEDADYKKVAKIASNVLKDIAEEFKEFIKRDDTTVAVAVVKLLNDDDLKKLKRDGNEMDEMLRKAEDIILKKAELNDHNEEELPLPKHDKDVQLVNENIIKEKVGCWRKRMGSLMSFLNDENFKKGLPEGAMLGLEVMDALSKRSGFQEVKENGKSHRYCGCCVVRFKGYRHRHDMSELAEIMVQTIKPMIDGCPLGSGLLTRRKRPDELENILGDFMEGFESRETLLRKILVDLQDDQVNIIGVYGMGGCGKTTLAKEVAYKRATDLFDTRVVVEVSEVPNIKGIQNQIAGGIGLTLEDMHTIAERARILYNQLKSEKKKILIILDNVWKKLKLDEVGIPYKTTKDFCCKLLITTREKRVCSLMDVQEANISEVGLLNEREALKLFENQAEKKVGSGEFKDVADRLLRKCGGLPLAITTTASALRGKNLRMWCHFAETSEKPISSQISSEYRETYSILETSYKLVDIEEKMIFLYLACLSPLDLAITVDDLMRYGIGLDLFQRVDSVSEATEQANTWANELISSSLLLKGDSNGEVKIHDLVRASAISFIDKGKERMTLVERIPRWMCKETFKKFTAISLMSGHDFSRLCGVKAPLLEILLLKGDVSLTTLPSDFFEGMKNLKVLSLSNVNFNMGLPESMGELERLQTLHLHNCMLKDIKLIGKLVNLLVLSLRGSTLEELAIEIGELCNLRLLDIEGCKGMKRIPANILSRLSHLEGLYMLNGFDGWASTNIEVNDEDGSCQASGSELDRLSHLNVLEMEVSKTEQLLTVNNGQLMEQLGKFKIRVRNPDGSREELPVFRNVMELIDIVPSPNSGLRALLKKTECLVLRDCLRLTKNVVPELDEDGFKDLKYLKVRDCEVKFVISSNEHNESSMTFANLEILELEYMDNLDMICDGKVPAGIFSNLRRLYLSNLRRLECGLSLTSGLLQLNEVSVKSCQSLKFIVYKDAKTAINETKVDMFPCLKSLHLSEVYSLSSVLGQSGNEEFALFNADSKYPSLEYIKLWDNRRIQTLWSRTSYVSSFQVLKVLHLNNCSGLQSLGSPSMFAALIQLEELQIDECDRLQEVISKETEGEEIPEKVINFPKLKRLLLVNSRNMERFYRGSYNLKFPNLKSLLLYEIIRFTNFDGSENSTTLFSDKIVFPYLEELNVQEVSYKVLGLWNWSSSSVVQGESESGSISFNPVPNLQILRLGKVHGLVSIPHSVTRKLSHLEVNRVNKFDNIKSLFSVSAVGGEALCTYSQLPGLKNLSVGFCESLEQLFETEDDDTAVSLCESLIEMTLKSMPKLKIFSLHLLKNIRTLSISQLSWKYLFIKGNEQLQLLENLNIEECKNMEVIIMDELVGDGEERVYSFPSLKILKLMYLDITKFASKPNTGIHFPSLESIEMERCNNIQSFWSGSFMAPKLKQVRVESCGNMQCFLSEKRNVVRELLFLETVEISGCSSLLSFSPEPLIAPKLHHVALDWCSKMKWFIRGDPNNNDIVKLPSLESVSINFSQGMKSFSSGGMEAPKLCELEVDEKDYSKLANEELQSMLANLPKYYTRREEEEEEEEEDEDEDEDDDDDDEEEEEEEEEEESDGEMEELRNDGSQDEPDNDGDEEQGNDEGDSSSRG